MIAPTWVRRILHYTNIAFSDRSSTLSVGFTRHCIALNRVECRRNLRQLFTLFHERPPEGADHLARSVSMASARAYASLMRISPGLFRMVRPMRAWPANQSRKDIPDSA